MRESVSRPGPQCLQVTTTQWAARFRDPCGTVYGGRDSESKAHLLQRYQGRERTQDSLDRRHLVCLPWSSSLAVCTVRRTR